MTMDKRIPITVLIISLIALIGSGFALDSTVTSTENRISEVELTIDMGDPDLLNADSEVSTRSVNGLLSGTIATTNNKTGENQGFKVTTYEAFTSFKIYGQNASAILFSIDDAAMTASGTYSLALEGGTFAEEVDIYELNTTNKKSVLVEETFVAGTIYTMIISSMDTTEGNFWIKLTATTDPEPYKP